MRARTSQAGDVTLAILAGGEGARMGTPKASLSVGGRPILEYLLERMPWPGQRWLITAPGRERPPGAGQFDREWVDPAAGLGPLRGVLTALEHLPTPLLVVTTVDMPGITDDHLHWLAGRLRVEGDLLAVMCKRTLGTHEQAEPFPLAIRKDAETIVRARLESGRRSVHGLLENTRFLAVPAPERWTPSAWINLNVPTDLRELENRGGRE